METIKELEAERNFLKWVHDALINNSQITFDNKSIIFENRLDEFNIIIEKLKERIEG